MRYRLKLMVAVLLYGAGCLSAAAESPRSTAVAAETPLTISAIVGHVRANGWPVDLKALCAALEINIGPRCLFLQIALHKKESSSNDHGFNVPADSGAPARIVLYHVTPLTGEFFLATSDGKLLKALFRSRGNAFETMPADQAVAAYRGELEFWQASLGRTSATAPH
jgi:hypothetical protein